MAHEADAYSVVVIGAMNPRIHHPSWYRAVGIFTEEEIAGVLTAQGVVVTPAFSQFSISDMIIKCIPDRWDIITSKLDNLERIYEIVYKLFDELLMHTPVNAIGLNFDYSRQTKCPDIPTALIATMKDAISRLGLTEPNACEVILRHPIDFSHQSESISGTASVHLRPEEQASRLTLACNYNYLLKFKTHFKFADFLPDLALQNRANAEMQLQSVLVTLTGTEEQNDAGVD